MYAFIGAFSSCYGSRLFVLVMLAKEVVLVQVGFWIQQQPVGCAVLLESRSQHVYKPTPARY